jgi:hypothetical protein
MTGQPRILLAIDEDLTDEILRGAREYDCDRCGTQILSLAKGAVGRSPRGKDQRKSARIAVRIIG